MNDGLTDLRQGDRYVVTEPLDGTFGASPVTLVNVSVSGVQILHAQPLRIGTVTILSFSHQGTAASVMVRVVWSHLSQTDEGLRYRSGMKLEESDVRYAAALNALLRLGAISADTDSLERKRQRELERDLRRKSSSKLGFLPPATQR